MGLNVNILTNLCDLFESGYDYFVQFSQSVCWCRNAYGEHFILKCCTRLIMSWVCDTYIFCSLLQTGYTLYERVIRPAEVGVTQAVENDAAENNDQA